LNTLIDRIDHIVLTVTDIEVTTQFYEKAFGFEREFFRGPEGQPRHALLFGQLKINLQDRNTETPSFSSGRSRSNPFSVFARP
jgi:catechol 2,3-dioxygenase-like lactoylglutathione lyase family enzyme